MSAVRLSSFSSCCIPFFGLLQLQFPGLRRLIPPHFERSRHHRGLSSSSVFLGVSRTVYEGPRSQSHCHFSWTRRWSKRLPLPCVQWSSTTEDVAAMRRSCDSLIAEEGEFARVLEGDFETDQVQRFVSCVLPPPFARILVRSPLSSAPELFLVFH